MSSGLTAAIGLGASDLSTYPERLEERENKFDEAIKTAWGVSTRRWRNFQREAKSFVALVNAAGPDFVNLDEAQLKHEAANMRRSLRRTSQDRKVLARSFALVREVSHRTLGKRHFDVQVMGAYALISGLLAEMETGQGKTLTATLAAGTAGLAGVPVHVVTVNDYLAERDAEEMSPLYEFLGLSVGVVQSGLSPEERKPQYACDICYCTNKDLVFDYLKDRIAVGQQSARMQMQVARLHGRQSGGPLLLRGLHFAIVDEADSIFIDEARTPLIISAKKDADGAQDTYTAALAFAQTLVEGDDYTINPRRREVLLSDTGKHKIHTDGKAIHPTRVGRQELVTQALSALKLYERDINYVIHEDKVAIVDESTGRLMPDRSWERGLHQMIELKEGCEMTGQNETLARITYQRFFRRYLLVAGMSGTVTEVADELWASYRLRVVRIPTHKPTQRNNIGMHLYETEDEKWQAIVKSVATQHETGRSVLIGTRSVGASEKLSTLLAAENIQHKVLNAKNDAEEADIVGRAGVQGAVTVATNMAGRGTDIKLGPGVHELGGLHVTLTEFHESGRVDRQLWGRCARQGDPGSFESFGALSDEVFERFGSRWVKVFRWMGLRLGTNASSDLVKRLVAVIQLSAERYNRRLRRQSVERDKQQDKNLAFSGKTE